MGILYDPMFGPRLPSWPYPLPEPPPLDEGAPADGSGPAIPAALLPVGQPAECLDFGEHGERVPDREDPSAVLERAILKGLQEVEHHRDASGT